MKTFEMSFYDRRGDYLFYYIVSAETLEEAKEKFSTLEYPDADYNNNIEEINISVPYLCM